MHRHLILALGYLGLTMLWSCLAPAAEFIDVNELLTDGYTIDNPGGMRISGDGSTLIGARLRPDIEQYAVEGFRWSEVDGEIGLGYLPGSPAGQSSDAFNVSADGSTVVGWCYIHSGGTGVYEAFRWSEAEGMIGLGPILDTQNVTHWSSSASAVSDDGLTVVGTVDFLYESERRSEPFRWTEAEEGISLGMLPGYAECWAVAVSADGSKVAGHCKSDSAYEAFLWTEDEGMISLGDLPGGEDYSLVRDISADGSTVIGESRAESGKEAFRWTASEGMVMLTRPEGVTSHLRARGVSADGSIIVGYYKTPIGGAFIWDTANGMRHLEDVLVEDYGLEAELAGWSLLGYAHSISDDGTVIVGQGLYPSSSETAGKGVWIAKIPELLEPVPGDFDGDRRLTAADIDRLSVRVLDGTHPTEFDLTNDSLVNSDDRIQWVEVLKNTYFGDANLDGEFSSSDWTAVFQKGEYEDAIAGNSGWADGDWSGDMEFTSRDFVVAFQRGGYEQGPREQAKAIPEPAGWLLIGLGLSVWGAFGRGNRYPGRHTRRGGKVAA